MSVEALDENLIKLNEPVVKKHEFRRLTVEEILNGRKKKRRRFSLRLYKKWLKERVKQNNILPFPARGTLSFARINSTERRIKIA